MKWYVSSAPPPPSDSSSWGLAFSFPLVGLGLVGVPLVFARLAAGGWEVSGGLSLALWWARREVVVSAFRAPRMSAGLSEVSKQCEGVGTNGPC